MHKDIIKKTAQGIIFIPLGGCGEIGMNLNVYGCNNKLLIVDMGLAFGKNDLNIDFVMPNFDFLLENKDIIEGIVITHAHEDHIGAVPYIWKELPLPIYSTQFTINFLNEKLKDRKIKKYNNINVVEPNKQFFVGEFGCKFIQLTHSIPDSMGLVLTTKHGTIFHTGDWKVDTDPVIGKKYDDSQIKKISKENILACISDSTNIFNNEYSGSEQSVSDELAKQIPNCKGKIIITCFASNIARIYSIIKVAQKNKRKVIFCGRSLWRMLKIAKQSGYMQDIGEILELSQSHNIANNKKLYVCTGSQGESRAALNRIINTNSLNLTHDDLIIFSSRIIPGNEKGVYDLYNKIAKFNTNIISIEQNDNIHVSGHPSIHEVKQLYKNLKPKFVIPVHGEYRHLQYHSKIVNDIDNIKSICIENGDAVLLNNNTPPKIISHVATSKMTVENNVLLNTNANCFSERLEIQNNGLFLVTIILDENLITDVQLNIYCTVIPDEDRKKCLQMIIKEFNHSQNIVTQTKKIKKLVYSTVSKFMLRTFNKNPLCIIKIVDL